MIKDVPVIILCGGRGILASEGSRRINKSLLRVAGRPIVCQVVDHYLKHGFRNFIFALGRQGQEIEREVSRVFSGSVPKLGLNLTFVDTGEDTLTGDRLKKAMQKTTASTVAVHYSDSLSDVDLADYYAFFMRSGHLASLVGARLPTRFKVLGLRPGESLVRGFADQFVISQEFVNGGHYFFSRQALGSEFLSADPGVVLENDLLGSLAKAGQLECYVHRSLWHSYDSERDIEPLEVIASRRG